MLAGRTGNAELLSKGRNKPKGVEATIASGPAPTNGPWLRIMLFTTDGGWAYVHVLRHSHYVDTRNDGCMVVLASTSTQKLVLQDNEFGCS